MGDAAQPVEVRAAALTERRHQGAQLRMHARAVIALVVVLAQHFPVRGHFVADRMTDPQLIQGVAREALGNSGELLLQGHGPGGRQIQEHEPAPRLDARRIQAEQCLVELRLTAQIGCGDQPTVEVVGPLVIRTGDTPGDQATRQPGSVRARRSRLPAQARPAVPADIVEGSQWVVRVAHQNDAFAEDIEQPERAGSDQLFLAPDTHPLAAEDPLLLHGKYALRAIPARRQGGFQTGQRRGQLVGVHVSLSRGASRREVKVVGSASSSRAYRWPLYTACTIAPGASASPMRVTDWMCAAARSCGRATSSACRESFAKRAPTITRDRQAMRVAVSVNWPARVTSPRSNVVTRASVCNAIPAANNVR